MPLYEYECDACHHRFEVIQKFSDAPIERCPACGGTVRKLLSSPAIQFKGSGWYITDYARKPASDGGSGSKPSTGGGDSSSPASTADKGASDAGGSSEKTGAGGKPAAS